MKKLLMILWILLSVSLCACAQPAEPEEPNHTENMTEIHYVWNRANMKMSLPEGWQWESDEHNQYGQTAWNEDLPDTVGFAFWPAEAPEMRFSFQCWTHTFGMCGTGVDFRHYDGEHKLTVATEGIDNGKSVQVTIIFNEVPGNYVVMGSVPTELWMAYQDQVIGIVDSATGGEGCMSYAEATELADAAIPSMSDAPEGGFYDVLTGQWRIVWRDGSMEVLVQEDGSTMGLDATPRK